MSTEGNKKKGLLEMDNNVVTAGGGGGREVEEATGVINSDGWRLDFW